MVFTLKMNSTRMVPTTRLAETLSKRISFVVTDCRSSSNAKLKGADGLDDLDEVIDVSPDLKKGGGIPVKAKGGGGGSSVVIEK